MDAEALRWTNKVKVERRYKIIVRNDSKETVELMSTGDRDDAMKAYNGVVKEGRPAKLVLEEYSYELLAETDNWGKS